MKEKSLVIVRGIPGSGKSTVARAICATEPEASSIICSADHYFTRSGRYVFNAKELPIAHDTCFNCALTAMNKGIDIVIVDNTNLKEQHLRRYIDAAKDKGYEVIVFNIIPPDPKVAAKRNTHNVPERVINKMFCEWHTEDPKLWNGVDVVITIYPNDVERAVKIVKNLEQ